MQLLFSSGIRKVIRRNYAQGAGDFRATLMKITGGSIDLTKDNSTGIAKIKLNHPDRKNALSGAMMCELSDIASELEAWKEGKGFLLYGTEKTFCSGGDLNTMNSIIAPDQGKQMSAFMHTTMQIFRRLPMISLALIQGRALGGGAELALTCDFRLITPKAKIGFVQSRLAIVPGWGGGYRLAQLVGEPTALELLSTGKVISAKEAVDNRLAIGITENEDNAEEEALEWLAARLTAPTETIHTMKNIVLNASNPDMETALHKENELFASVWGGPGHLEALGKGMKHK